MKKLFFVMLLAGTTAGSLFAQKKSSKTAATVSQTESVKFRQDKEAIKAMAGCYKVTFEFAETFAPDTAYKYMDRKFDWGIEYVMVVEESDKKVILQHLLVVNDTFIVKHWRQDWLFENTDLFVYNKNYEWKKKTLTSEEAKGTWTQKVYQVDDSPRYESYGTWVHVDGRHFWEGTGDAPLPRREATKPRLDYNVMRRHSHIEIFKDGNWILEQDNEKLNRTEAGDKLICWEKGFETFTKGDYNCQPAIDYWARSNKYWADVRKVWNEIFSSSNSLKFQRKVDDKMLFEQLFKLEGELSADYNSKKAESLIRQTIEKYLVKG